MNMPRIKLMNNIFLKSVSLLVSLLIVLSVCIVGIVTSAETPEYWNGVTDKPLEIVDRAIRMGCEKVQLFKPYFNQESVIKARNHGIICNVFWADDPDEAVEYLKMGIDTILTNDYLQISRAVKKYVESL